MKYMITGGCGFLGTNLSAEILKRKQELVIFDNLVRNGSISNLHWLKKQGSFNHYNADIRNINDIETVINIEKPDVIFHLAGQVTMTRSILDPRYDFEVNVIGTFNLLDVLRKRIPKAIIVYSSTNKVYGDLSEYTYQETDKRYICQEYPTGFDERIPLNFQSPYGCSKGSADQYVLDFYRIYGIKSLVLRHSSMYGGRQFATEDQGWVGWFCRKAIEIKNGLYTGKVKISGTGKQVRDLLFSDDAVDLYLSAIPYIDKLAGKAFNIGGGISNSLSLIELFHFLEENLRISISIEKGKWRESDQKVFVADHSAISQIIQWAPRVTSYEGVMKTIDWLRSQ